MKQTQKSEEDYSLKKMMGILGELKKEIVNLNTLDENDEKKIQELIEEAVLGNKISFVQQKN